MKDIFCEWYGKELKDVTEHEQESCYEQAGWECTTCPELNTGDNEEEWARKEKE